MFATKKLVTTCNYLFYRISGASSSSFFISLSIGDSESREASNLGNTRVRMLLGYLDIHSERLLGAKGFKPRVGPAGLLACLILEIRLENVQQHLSTSKRMFEEIIGDEEIQTRFRICEHTWGNDSNDSTRYAGIDHRNQKPQRAEASSANLCKRASLCKDFLKATNESTSSALSHSTVILNGGTDTFWRNSGASSIHITTSHFT